jgi:hypothetical protein
MSSNNLYKSEDEIIREHENKKVTGGLINGLILLAGIGGLGYFVTWVMDRPSHFLEYPNTALEELARIGAVGDANGGLMGPPIAIAGAILTFLAFFIQYVANWHQKNQFNLSIALQRRQYAEDKRIREDEKVDFLLNKEKETKEQIIKEHRERVESRFFELIKLHKENVSEMYLTDNVTGRRCFGSMYYELKTIYDVILEVIKMLNTGRAKEYSEVDPTKM